MTRRPQDPKGERLHPLRVKGRDEQNKKQAAPAKSSPTPTLSNVYAAYHGGHINEEEAKGLNNKFEPNKRMINGRSNGKLGTVTQKTRYNTYRKGSGGFKPSLPDVHKARQIGAITVEEAKELNPKYPKSAKTKSGRKHINDAIYLRESQKTGYTPRLTDVHEAVIGGHITNEEANELSQKYKNANKSKKQGYKDSIGRKKSKKEGKTPSLQSVHSAKVGGHISTEEAVGLNPSYNPNNKKQVYDLERQNSFKEKKEVPRQFKTLESD